MSKKKKKISYGALGSAQDIDKRFYSRLNTDWLMNKVDALMLLVKDEEGMKGLVERAEGDPGDVTPKLLESLRAEIHMAEFQQFEALLAFLLCPYQELPHWLYMSKYRTVEIHDACRALLADDAAALTAGHIDSMHPVIRVSVYSEFFDSKRAEEWSQNLDNILWFLKRVAHRYSKAGEYNAYKHGVRVLTGAHRMTVTPDSSPERARVLAESKDSLSYLETRNVDGTHRLFEMTRHFNPDVSFNHMFIMSSLLETVRSTRLARLSGEQGTEINTFFKIDKGMLHEMDNRFWVRATL